MKSVRDLRNSIGNIAGKSLLGDPSDKLQASTDYTFLTGIVREIVTNPYEYLNRDFKIGSKNYAPVKHSDILSERVDTLPDGKTVDSPVKNNWLIDNMPMNSIFVQIVDDSRGSDGEKMTSLGKSDNSNISQESYSDFLKNSYSYVNEFIGEPVPRMTKNSSDLLLQGSNNAGIHLTTEKFLQDYITTDADNLKSEFLGDTPPNFDKIKSPAIDLFVNRKKDTSNSSGRGNGPTAIYNTSATSGGINTTRNVSDGDAKLSHIEIDKIRDVVGNNDAGSIYEEELSNEAQNVGARLYMTNYCDVDVQFDSAIDGLDEQTGPSLVNYADYIRSIGKKDVRLISQNGESLINMDENGEIKIKASKDDGQQFLYLTPGSGGYTRINSAGKIYLTHGNDNNLPDNNDEPYVLASQLEAVLKTIFDVLNAHANLMIGLAPMRFPPMIPGAAQLVNQFLGTNAPTISTPSSKYSPAVELPPLAAPYTAKAAVIAGILKHKDIIADKG